MRRHWLYILLLMSSVLTLSAQPLTLDSCLRLAKENNRELRNAALDVRKAEEVKKQAFTKYFPNISGMALGYHSLNPMVEVGVNDIVHNRQAREILNMLYKQYGAALGIDNTLSLFQHGVVAGVTAVQPIFAGGQIVNGNRLAKVGIEAAALQAEIAEREILQTVEESYWLVVGLEDKQQTLRAVETLLDTVQNNVRTAIAAGLAIENDMLRVEIKKNEIRSQTLQLNNGLRLARQALCQAVGIPYSDTLQIADSIAHAPHLLIAEEDPAVYVDSRPESRLLGLQVEAEQLQKKMDIGKTLPQIGFGLAYSYNDMLFDKDAHNGTAFFTVSVPLTDWWETSHKLKQRDYSIEQARNTEEDMREKMILQNTQTYNAMQEAAEHLNIISTTIENAKENLRLSQLNYRAGLVPLSDLLEAQTLYLQAQNDYTDALIAYKVNLRRWEELK